MAAALPKGLNTVIYNLKGDGLQSQNKAGPANQGGLKPATFFNESSKLL